MESSEDAENMNHLQYYGQPQVTVNAVGQRRHGL